MFDIAFAFIILANIIVYDKFFFFMQYSGQLYPVPVLDINDHSCTILPSRPTPVLDVTHQRNRGFASNFASLVHSKSCLKV